LSRLVANFLKWEQALPIDLRTGPQAGEHLGTGRCDASWSGEATSSATCPAPSSQEVGGPAGAALDADEETLRWDVSELVRLFVAGHEWVTFRTFRKIVALLDEAGLTARQVADVLGARTRR
jgi:hypothetical protein